MSLDGGLIEKAVDFVVVSGTGIVQALAAGLVGMVGSIASFFYEIDKGKKSFTFKRMFIVSFVGFVLGTAAGAFVPTGENWYGWTLVVGLNTYPIMEAMSEKASMLIKKILKRVE